MLTEHAGCFFVRWTAKLEVTWQDWPLCGHPQRIRESENKRGKQSTIPPHTKCLGLGCLIEGIPHTITHRIAYQNACSSDWKQALMPVTIKIGGFKIDTIPVSTKQSWSCTYQPCLLHSNQVATPEQRWSSKVLEGINILRCWYYVWRLWLQTPFHQGNHSCDMPQLVIDTNGYQTLLSKASITST